MPSNSKYTRNVPNTVFKREYRILKKKLCTQYIPREHITSSGHKQPANNTPLKWCIPVAHCCVLAGY